MEHISIFKNVKFRYGFAEISQLTEWLDSNMDKVVGISFVGRSNVGKSSLINGLFSERIARTSKTPGRTQQINIFSFELKDREATKELYLFDLPGYGFAKVSKKMTAHWNYLMTEFFAKTLKNNLLINIQDARHPNQASDQEFQKFLDKGTSDSILVFNKIDKLKTQKEKSAFLKETNQEVYKKFNHIFKVSAEKTTGLDKLQDFIEEFMNQHL